MMGEFKSRQTMVRSRGLRQLDVRLWNQEPLRRVGLSALSGCFAIGAMAVATLTVSRGDRIGPVFLSFLALLGLFGALQAAGWTDLSVQDGRLTRRRGPIGRARTLRLTDLCGARMIERKEYDEEGYGYRLTYHVVVDHVDGWHIALHRFPRSEEAGYLTHLLETAMQGQTAPRREEIGFYSRYRPPRGPSLIRGRTVARLLLSLLVGGAVLGLTRVALGHWGESVLCDDGMRLEPAHTTTVFDDRGGRPQRIPMSCVGLGRTAAVDGRAFAYALPVGGGVACLVFATLMCWVRRREASMELPARRAWAPRRSGE